MTENMKDLEDALVLQAQALRDNTAALEALYNLFKERGAAGNADTVVVVDPMKKLPATIEEVQASLVEVAQKIGRDKAAEILLKHGANKLPDLKPDAYADAISEAEAMLEAVA